MLGALSRGWVNTGGAATGGRAGGAGVLAR